MQRDEHQSKEHGVALTRLEPFLYKPVTLVHADGRRLVGTIQALTTDGKALFLSNAMQEKLKAVLGDVAKAPSTLSTRSPRAGRKSVSMASRSRCALGTQAILRSVIECLRTKSGSISVNCQYETAV